MVPLAFGTQTVGSIIRPASFCGVVGYKPSFGTLSRAGIKLLAESLDTVGTIARTVDDAALMVGALSGRGELVELAKIDRPWIGICRTHDWRETQPEVGEALDAAARGLAAAGARVIQVDLPPSFAALGDAHGDILGYELARNLGFEHAHHGVRLSSRLRELLDAGLRGSRPSATTVLASSRICPAPRCRACSTRATCSSRRARPAKRPRASSPPGNPVMNRVWTLLHVPCVTVPGRDRAERAAGRAAGDRPDRRRRAHAVGGALDPRTAGRGLRMRSRYWLIAIAAVAVLLSGCSKLTPENYAKLKSGLTYAEVKSILGEPARCDDLVGFKSCRWGDDSRNITVRFAGDQVVLYSAENVR